MINKAKRQQHDKQENILAKCVTVKGLILMIHKAFHRPIRNHPKEKWGEGTNKYFSKYRCTINIEKCLTVLETRVVNYTVANSISDWQNSKDLYTSIS